MLAIANAGNMDVHCYERGAAPQVMDLFTTEGRKRVPVFAVFDGETEVLRWIERPQVAEAYFAEIRTRESRPDRETLEADLADRSTREAAAREILAGLLERGLLQQPAG